jgi:hypothetical protein
MGEFTQESTVRQVLEHPNGRRLLWDHGYDVGEGFVDVLSQHQSLLEAARSGRLRDVDGLLDALKQDAGGRSSP